MAKFKIKIERTIMMSSEVIIEAPNEDAAYAVASANCDDGTYIPILPWNSEEDEVVALAPTEIKEKFE